jgi:hypothetical protein
MSCVLSYSSAVVNEDEVKWECGTYETCEMHTQFCFVVSSEEGINHCCCGKAMRIKYSECVLVALCIQHAMRMRLIIL